MTCPHFPVNDLVGSERELATTLTVLAAAGSAVSASRSRTASAACGAALIAASAATRWGIFHADLASAQGPRCTIAPQRDRAGPARSLTLGRGCPWHC